MAVIVIQAGHCFRTSGATGTNGLDGDPNEQEFTWAAANRAAELVRATGHDARVILADVPDTHYVGDGFVAIHCDGSTSSSARGASVGYRTDDGADFAARWKRHYAAQGWSGFRPDNYTSALAGYYGVRHAVEQGNRRAFIAEAGFLTSPDDEALLSLPGGPERFARALVNTVVEVFGGTTLEDDMTPEQEAKLDQAVAAANGAALFAKLVWDLNTPAGFRYVDPKTFELVSKDTPGAKPVLDVVRHAREAALGARRDEGDHATLEDLLADIKAWVDAQSATTPSV